MFLAGLARSLISFLGLKVSLICLVTLARNNYFKLFMAEFMKFCLSENSAFTYSGSNAAFVIDLGIHSENGMVENQAEHEI